MEVAQRHQDQLKSIKKDVEKSFVSNKANIERFHKFQKFVFQTAISEQEEDTLKSMGKPVIEFNITQAPVSRLCGEFSKQEPSIYVSADEGNPVDPATLEVVEGHLRHILFEAKKHNTQYNIYRDQLSGGFCSGKVWTEYANEMSFDQVIRFGRVYDPTLVGYDSMAREVDKSDAEYCYEIFPMNKERFKNEYPKINIDDVGFRKMDADFNWSYSLPNNDQIIILCDFYRKKKRRERIVKTAENKVMTLEDYNSSLEEWEAKGYVHQPPAIIEGPRWTDISYICRYRVMETQVIEYIETSFKYLPLVFADGDSVILKNGEGSTLEQFCKPYIYHAEGIQKLTNFAGQVIANDFENMVMHKFKVAEESLPDQAEYRAAYKEYQLPNTLIYKHLWNDNPDVPLPAPEEIARVPLPQEVIQTFNTSMQMLQNILGSYDASLGINDNQLSGVAIVEGATQSNAAAMPYVINHMQMLNQVATIIVDLIPKFYKTPRTIPVIDREGKRTYVKINDQNGQGVQFNYDENVLQVKVEAGVNFSIAKNKALQQIIALMNASPKFAEFINDQGLETLLDNIEFRNVDILKSKVEAWLKKKESESSPEMIKAQAEQKQAQLAERMGEMEKNIQMFQLQLAEKKLDLEGEKTQAETMLKTEQIVNDKAKIDNERLSIMQKAGESKDKLIVGVRKAEAEEERARADMHLDAHSLGHSQTMETLKHSLEIDKHEHEKSKGLDIDGV